MATATVAAEAADVKIVGRGTLAGSGLPFLLVSSASEPGRAHCVAYAYEGAYVGARLHCDCVAASYGRGCKHVRLVAAWLAEQMTTAPQTSDTQRTPRGGKRSGARRANLPAAAPRPPHPPDARDTAILRREPFRFMK